ncbi:MAG: alpha/beta hydrolase [Hyphomonadaceae bacterium]
MSIRHFSSSFFLLTTAACVAASQPAFAFSVSAVGSTPTASTSAPSVVGITASDAGTLRGTLLPATAGKSPLAILIPGSGPTDQDGNGPFIKTDTYRLLANGLQAAGISSLRIDKRGMFSSASDGVDPNAVSLEAYGRDMRAWINEMAPQSPSKCVWLIGHSEGGLVAIATAAESSAGICGLILLASPGRRASDVMRQQLRANPANSIILDDALGAIARLEQGHRVDVTKMHPALQQLFAPAVQGFLISLFQFDPAVKLQKHNLPVLIVQGREDLQVTLEDAAALGNGRPNTIQVNLDGVTHTLKAIPKGDVAANQATYSNPKLPLAPGFIKSIAEFIADHAKP